MRDHGIGIAPADQKRIFGRFERAVSTRHYGGLGLGLGLFIVDRIVAGLGGTVHVESQRGVYTMFSVQLPIAGPQEPPATPLST